MTTVTNIVNDVVMVNVPTVSREEDIASAQPRRGTTTSDHGLWTGVVSPGNLYMPPPLRYRPDVEVSENIYFSQHNLQHGKASNSAFCKKFAGLTQLGF
jgi:hypothetical protein